MRKRKESMESFSNETNSSDETTIKFPIEVNVVVNNEETQSISSRSYAEYETQAQTTDTLIYSRNKEVIQGLRLQDSTKLEMNKGHPARTLRESEKQESRDDVLMNCKNGNPTAAKDALDVMDLEIDLEFKVETESASIDNIPPGEANLSYEEMALLSCERPKDKDSEEFETVTRFLNDLFDKKLDLNNKFSDEEIKDIHEAVNTQVKLLAKTLDKIDSRLKIQELIPAGSAREGTQIVRPCEFDYILTLENISKPGAVSITPADPESSTREYMHVKLQDDNLKSIFQDLSDNDYIRATHWLSCLRQGLKTLFSTAVYQAIMLCVRSFVKTSTGELKFKRSKPETHGPACTIELQWKSKADQTLMEISLDLCPAVKVNCEVYFNALPAEDCRISKDMDYIRNFGSVLLMPIKGTRFRVTFTEAEIQFTRNLSEHHRKCYKILKYLVNGEPFPLECEKNSIRKYLLDKRTQLHSYALKLIVWEHHYVKQCCQKADMGMCIYGMLEDKVSNLGAEGIRHPFNPFTNSYTSNWVERVGLSYVKGGLGQIRDTPIEVYNYDSSCEIVTSKPPKLSLPAVVRCICLIIIFIPNIVIAFRSSGSENFVLGTILMYCSITYLFLTPETSSFKRQLLPNHLRNCTMISFDAWLRVTCSVIYVAGLTLCTIDTEKGWVIFLYNGLIYIMYVYSMVTAYGYGSIKSTLAYLYIGKL